MSKEAVFTMKLEPELRAEFMAEAEASHRPASQILRELMREFGYRPVAHRKGGVSLSLELFSAVESWRSSVRRLHRTLRGG